jgi:alanine dehydrogenase
MIIGVPREIKNNEFRVALTPAGVYALKKAGHKILVEKDAGLGSGISDSDYISAGGEIGGTPEQIYTEADLIVKVKEPLESEYSLLQNGKILFTYLHLAPNAPLVGQLMDKCITGIGYETVQLPNGTLPLLAPMSEVAGRMSVQIGANLMQKTNGGSGMLLGGVPGVPSARVVVAGGGIAGFNAARMAMGLGAHVTVLDVKKERLDSIDELTSGRISTLYSNEYNMSEAVKQADLLISTVLIAGAKAPKVVTEEMVRSMKKGSVIVDIAIDQGGSVETVDHATTHENPTFEKHGVIHYAVANIPGAVPKTSTYALTGVTLPYILKIASLGVNKALISDQSLMRGLNTYKGFLTCKGVAEAQNLLFTGPEELLSH